MRTARGRRGYSIAEVLIGMLLTALVVASVMSVVLTAKRGSSVSDARVAANNSARKVLERLKNYITASLGEPGPNGGLTGNAGWSLPGDTCGPPAGKPGGTCASPCYALDTACAHNVTSLMPAELTGPPYAMVMWYDVADLDPGAGQANFRPKVDVKVDWQGGP